MSNITDPLARMTALVTFGLIISVNWHLFVTGEVNEDFVLGIQIASYLAVGVGALNAIVKYLEER